MCSAREQLGRAPAPPALPPSLPRPLPRPVQPLPACPATPRPAGQRAGGSEGGLAGRRTARLPGPGHGAPDSGAAPAGTANEGGRGGRGRWGAGRLGGRSGRSQRPRALRHAGTVLPRRSLAPRGPPSSRRAEGPVLLRAPRFLRSPHPPLRDHGRRRSPHPPPPRPAAVTLAAPAQRPTACSATPGGWEGPLHPGSFPPPSHCHRTLTLGGPSSPRRALVPPSSSLRCGLPAWVKALKV